VTIHADRTRLDGYHEAPAEEVGALDDDDRDYQVVVNDEEQYSIWLVDQTIPDGWRAVGPSGPKTTCLAYIEEVWTDMRPLSLRQRMDATANGSPSPS
jgi:MbtH protein